MCLLLVGYVLAMCWLGLVQLLDKNRLCDGYVLAVWDMCWRCGGYALVNCWLYVEYVCYDGIVLVIGWLCVGYVLAKCLLCVC